MAKETKGDKWKDLKEAWTNFLKIILNPLVIILLAGIITLIGYTPHQEMENYNPIYTKILTVIISIVSGVVGAVISKKWIEINEAGKLVTRGKSAIRGLKLLLRNISSLEDRVNIHLNRLFDNEDKFSEITQHNYEEILEKCSSLEEEALNAVEEWEDIIPEANVSTKIGVISRLKKERENLEKEVNDIRKEKDESTEVSEELTKELKEKEKELKEVKKELRSKEWELDHSILSGVDDNVSTKILTTSKNLGVIKPYQCLECNKEFESVEINPECPSCESKSVILNVDTGLV